MFRANMCPSSGEITVFLRHLVLVILYGWLSVCTLHTRMTSTMCRINTVVSPDDGHVVVRNMYRKAINIVTYLITPCSTVLLEKLTGSAASQEIPRIFGTRRFIIVLTSARRLSLSWANSIQSSQPPPTSWRKHTKKNCAPSWLYEYLQDYSTFLISCYCSKNMELSNFLKFL